MKPRQRKSKPASARRAAKRVKDPNRYPQGWNRQKVEDVIKHYENQTEEQAMAEDEAAYTQNGTTMMQIPNDLVPKVQKLISKRAS